MRRLGVLAAVLLGTVLLTSCAANLEKAKQELLAQEDTRPPVAVAVLFDNSASYRDWVEPTLSEVRLLFQCLAARHPEAGVSLVLVASEPQNIFSGKAARLQTAYDDLARILRHGRSPYTDLSMAVNHASYFLEKADPQRKVMIIFSDLKHSTPSYYPRDARTVPPPEDFPWDRVDDVDVFAVYAPFAEWRLWNEQVEARGLQATFQALLPEEMKATHVADAVLPRTGD